MLGRRDITWLPLEKKGGEWEWKRTKACKEEKRTTKINQKDLLKWGSQEESNQKNERREKEGEVEGGEGEEVASRVASLGKKGGAEWICSTQVYTYNIILL